MRLKLFQLPVLICLVFFILSGCSKNEGIKTSENETGTFVDSRDQKTYEWVKIGTQIWMAKNLAYNTSSGCWAYNNDEANVSIYGYLYDWGTAQTVAPAEWHLPSQDEWNTLVSYLGGSDEAYDKLLESGTAHWESPNSGTNDSKFAALPSGYFDQRDNTFNFLGHLTMFHSTTANPSNDAYVMGLILNPNYPTASIEGRPKELALPIRCIKD